MVWVLSLSDMDLSTHALTADQHLLAFGVCQELVGDEMLRGGKSTKEIAEEMMRDQERQQKQEGEEKDKEEPVSEEEAKEIYNRWARKMGKPTI